MSEGWVLDSETGQTILVADDNAALLSMLCVMLQKLGYRVISARDGAEAVELFEQDESAVDLLVLDVVMPRMRGTDAAAEMRKARPDIPLLFITGYADEIQREKMEKLGNYTEIPKPLSIAYLGQTIQTLLNK